MIMNREEIKKRLEAELLREQEALSTEVDIKIKVPNLLIDTTKLIAKQLSVEEHKPVLTAIIESMVEERWNSYFTDVTSQLRTSEEKVINDPISQIKSMMPLGTGASAGAMDTFSKLKTMMDAIKQMNTVLEGIGGINADNKAGSKEDTEHNCQNTTTTLEGLGEDSETIKRDS